MKKCVLCGKELDGLNNYCPGCVVKICYDTNIGWVVDRSEKSKRRARPREMSKFLVKIVALFISVFVHVVIRLAANWLVSAL